MSQRFAFPKRSLSTCSQHFRQSPLDMLVCSISKTKQRKHNLVENGLADCSIVSQMRALCPGNIAPIGFLRLDGYYKARHDRFVVGVQPSPLASATAVSSTFENSPFFSMSSIFAQTRLSGLPGFLPKAGQGIFVNW